MSTRKAARRERHGFHCTDVPARRDRSDAASATLAARDAIAALRSSGLCGGGRLVMQETNDARRRATLSVALRRPL